MKAKVIQFKSDGNSIKTSTVELTEFIKGVWYFTTDNESESVNLVFEHNGVYAVIDRISTYRIEENITKIEHIRDNLECTILAFNWINIVHLEFARLSGMDYEKMLQRRNEISESRRIEKEKLEAEREQRNKDAITEYTNKVEGYLTSLKNGDYITFEGVAEIIQHKNIKVHPRTMGTINKLYNYRASNSTCYFPKGFKRSSSDTIFNLIKDIVENY